MCGINLVLSYPEAMSERIISNMMDATQHRGPDSSAWLRVDDGVYVAGNRLKVLDLSDNANQPLVTADGNGILVWNGAVYNFQDLRNELLSSGIQFSGGSDSEVLLYWIYQFGVKGFDRISGMFSLVFIDKRTKTILVARDSLGQKPLYYHQDRGKWLFSSELRSLLASAVIPKTWDSRQYLPYFFLRHSYPKETFVVGIHQVKPGEVVLLKFDGTLIGRTSIPVVAAPIPLPDVSSFEELLVDSVLKHFHADVPVGVILSGGADSTLLYQTWFRETGVPLHSYTAVFEQKYQKSYEDFRFAKCIAKKCHGKHHEVVITPADFLRLWPHYVNSIDHPVGDSAGFLTWMIGREASADVRVLIAGVGADELFSGYNRHRAFLQFLRHPRFALKLKRFFPRLRLLPRVVQKAVSGIGLTPSETYMNFAALQPIPSELHDQLSHLFEPKDEPYKAALNWDRDVYLVNDILSVFDNATMAHGIEGRAPYLDTPLVSLSRSLTAEQHYAIAPKKWIKTLLQSQGLAEIAKRKKMGFGLPLKEWFRDNKEFRNEVFSLVKQFEMDYGQDFPVEMRKLAQKPESGVTHSFLELWNIYLLASWRYSQNL